MDTHHNSHIGLNGTNIVVNDTDRLIQNRNSTYQELEWDPKEESSDLIHVNIDAFLVFVNYKLF